MQPIHVYLFVIVKEFLLCIYEKLHNKMKVVICRENNWGHWKFYYSYCDQPEYNWGVYISYINLKLIMFGYTVSDRHVFSLSPSLCDDSTGQALEDRNINIDLALGLIVPPPSDRLSILEGSRMSKKEYTAIQVSLVCPAPALQLKMTSASRNMYNA